MSVLIRTARNRPGLRPARWPYRIDYSSPLAWAQGGLKNGTVNGKLRFHLSWPTDAMMPAELAGEWAPTAIGTGMSASKLVHRDTGAGAIRGMDFVTNNENLYNTTTYAATDTELWTISALVEFPLYNKAFTYLVAAAGTTSPLATSSGQLGVYRDASFSGFGVYYDTYTGLTRLTVRGGWDGSFSGGKRAELFVNGHAVGTAASNPWRYMPLQTIGNEIYTMARDRGFGKIFDIQAWYGVYADDAWIKEQAENPYGLLEEYGRRTYFIPAAAGGGASGALAVTLDGATAAAAGRVIRRGSLARTLASATLAAAGKRLHYGQLAESLDPTTLAASGTAGGVSGAVAGQLDDATAAGAGRLVRKGTATLTLVGTTAAAAGKVTHRGAMSRTLDAVVLFATGSSAGYVPSGIHMRRFWRRYRK